MLIDLIIAGILVYGAVRGLWNGFFVEFASLISLFLGIWIALKFANYFKTMLETQTSWNPQMILMLSFGLPFVLTLIALVVASRFFTSVLSVLGLSLFNKILGALLGLLKAVLALAVVLNFFETLNSDESFATRQTLDNMIFYDTIRDIGAEIYPEFQRWHFDKDEERETDSL
jgi:membrane protein required for colicin V production